MTESAREGSLTFSLAELSRLEGDRVRQEDDVRRRQAVAALEAAREAAAVARRKEEEVVNAREELRVARSLLTTEAEARRATEREAAAARAEVQAARVAEATREAAMQRLAREPARTRPADGAADWRRLAIVSWILAAAAIAACLVIDLAIVRPDSARRVALAEAQTASLGEELRDWRARASRAEGAAASLGERLESATRRDDLRAAPDVARAPRTPPKSPVPRASQAPPVGTVGEGPFHGDCPPGSRDPLCGLGR